MIMDDHFTDRHVAYYRGGRLAVTARFDFDALYDQLRIRFSEKKNLVPAGRSDGVPHGLNGMGAYIFPYLQFFRHEVFPPAYVPNRSINRSLRF
jgi:hypothetical protein